MAKNKEEEEMKSKQVNVKKEEEVEKMEPEKGED